MSQVVEVKVRQVGNALGVILPSGFLKEEEIKEGETVFVSVFKSRKVNFEKFFGMTRGAEPFERDHSGRS